MCETQTPARGGLLFPGGRFRPLAARLPGSLGIQLQGGGVDAPALAGGSGPVVEDMTQVASAAAARDLGAPLALAPILIELDTRGVDRGGEAGPARTRVELGVGEEKLGATSGAAEETNLPGVGELAPEGGIGALLPEHVVLLRGEAGAPLRLSGGDLLLDALTHAHSSRNCDPPLIIATSPEGGSRSSEPGWAAVRRSAGVGAGECQRLFDNAGRDGSHGGGRWAVRATLAGPQAGRPRR